MSEGRDTHDAAAVQARLAHVDAWVFDLDNTLYPRHVNLFQQVDKRIREYVARLLGVPHDEAARAIVDEAMAYRGPHPTSVVLVDQDERMVAAFDLQTQEVKR